MRIVQLAIIAATLTTGIALAGDDDGKLFDAFEKVLRSRNVKEVKAFMKKNPKAINAQNSSKVTPLHFAAKYATEDIVKAMLAKGAKVNAKTDGLSTPLHYAGSGGSINGNRDIIALLIKKRADLKAKDEYGRTPLFNCCNPQDAAYMISKGAKTNVIDKYGWSLLLKYCDDGKEDMVNFYLKKKLDPKIKDKEGETALHRICNHFTDLKLLKQFIDFGIDVNAVDENGKTALVSEIFFVRKDSDQVVEILLKAGAKVNIADKDGNQPLKAMCNNWLDAGREDEAGLAVAKLLVAKGADVNAKNKYGQTALDDLLGRDDSPVKTIAFLKSKGCKPGKKKE